MPEIQDEFSHISNKNVRLYFRRKRDGVCPHCGGKPVKGYVWCAKARANKRKHYLKTRKLKKKDVRGNYKGRPSKFLTSEVNNQTN